MNGKITGRAIGIIMICGCIFCVNQWYKNWSRRIPLDAYVGATAETLEKRYKLEMVENPALCSKLPVPDGKTDNLSVKTADGLSVIYRKDIPFGLFITNKKYTLYNIEIGYSESEMYKKITYPYDKNYEMLNDISNGMTDQTFFEGKNGSLLVVSRNNVSHRVVAVTYYANGYEYTKNLSPID